MIHKENNTVNTDQAWYLLHARLEQDGLLSDKVEKKSRKLSNIAGWAAAILLLCIAVATVLSLQNKKMDINLITLHNEKGSITLVKTLEDGSIVYLSDDTQLQYPEHFSSDKRVVKLEGNALFDVAGNNQCPFLIETEQIEIEVIGTSFNVKSANHIPFELSVERGEVKVTWKKTGETVHVKAGETVSLSSNLLVLEQTDNDIFIEQLTKRIRFKDETLENILQVINKRTSEIEIEVTPALANRRITISLDNDTPETIARLLCTAFNLTYEKIDNKLLISEQ